MERVNIPAKYLKGIVKDKQIYYIGFGITDLTEITKSYPAIKDLISGKRSRIVVTGRRGVLKENTDGKLVRKQPESKHSEWKHIEYYSRKHEKMINYDRDFFKWVKVILHKYNMELELAKTPQDEIVLHFPQFKFQDNESHYLKAGAAMNMSIKLGSYFMIYDAKFEPIVPVTKYEHRLLLPPGLNLTIKEKLETIEDKIKGLKSENKSLGNSYRFAMLKEKKLNDVTMGIGGFNEYLMFEYREDNLMILENLRSGNATYIFDLKKFDRTRPLNKQTASKDPAFLKRVVHENIDSWTSQLNHFFNVI